MLAVHQIVAFEICLNMTYLQDLLHAKWNKPSSIKTLKAIVANQYRISANTSKQIILELSRQSCVKYPLWLYSYTRYFI